MAAPTAGILDTVLNNFRSQIDAGYGSLTGPVQGTLGAVIVISVAAMAIMWAVDETTNIWGPLIRKVLLVGFWSYMITNWQTLAMAAISAFGKLGITAGGGAAGLSDFLNSPSKVFAYGLIDAKSLYDFCLYCLGKTNTGWGAPAAMPVASLIDPGAILSFYFQQLPIIIETIICIAILLFAYAWIALEVVCVVIEFHIVTLVAFIVLPFGILSQTSSLAENSIAYVFRAGFKAMVLGIVISLGTNFLTNYTLVESSGNLPTIDTFCGLALSVVIILMLALSAPKYAAAVASGSPTTGAGGMAGTVGGIVGAGVAAYNVGKLASGHAAKAMAGSKGGGDNNGGGGFSTANAAAAGALGGSTPPGSPPGGAGTGGSGGSPGSDSAAGAAPSGGGSSQSSVRGSTGSGSVKTSAGASNGGGTAQTPWYDQKGGVAALSAVERAEAESNYADYLALNLNPPEGFNFERFVEVGQADHVDPVSPATA